MTATEVMERQAEKAAILGPVIGRIESDVLDKIIAVAFRQAVQAGRIPPAPPALGRLVGTPIQVEYIGPLAQASKKFHIQHGIQQSLSMFGGLMQMDPNVSGLLKWEDVGRRLLESTGMPQDVVRDRREYAEWVQAMERAAQAQDQREQQAQMMQNADKLSQAPEPGSPMQEINRSMQGSMAMAQGGV
jgi:hypothetical protein